MAADWGPPPPWSLEPECVALKLAHPEVKFAPAEGMPHVLVTLPDGWIEVFDQTWADVMTRLRKRAPELFRRRQDSG